MHHEVDDPTWEPPENFEDSDDANSDISEDKITDFLPDNNIADIAVPGDNVELNTKTPLLQLKVQPELHPKNPMARVPYRQILNFLR